MDLHYAAGMNKIGVLAFGVTTCVLVPTTLHVLQAGPNQVAKLVAPDMTSIQVGDAKVDVTMDKGLVDAGGKVHVTLTATSDKRDKVALSVLVYEQAGMGEGRTEAPPNRVGRDEVTLDTKDGKASKTFTFTLPGNRAGTMDGMATFGHYTVLVMPPKLADELEKRRRHTKDSGSDPQNFFSAYYDIKSGANVLDVAPGSDVDVDAANPDVPDTSLGKSGQIARLDLSTRTAASHIKIIAGDIAHADDDIAVKVRVTNPTKRDFDSVDISLRTQPEALGGTWAGIAPESVEIVADAGSDGSAADGTQSVALKAHETKDVVFHVKTSETGTLGLYASMACSGDHCYVDNANGNDYRIVEDLADSVLDGVDIMEATDHTQEQGAPQTAQQDAVAPAIAAAQKQADDNAAKQAATDAADVKAKALAKDPWAVALEPNTTAATKPVQTAQTAAKNPELK